MLEQSTDWFLWAGRLNQLSLVPFLGFLWTLWHLPNAPKKAVQGFTFYLAFIAVAIPAGIYCKSQLGTSMANVDWVHGPCEVLLTTANLLIVLGLRDALRNTTPDGTDTINSSSSSSSTQDRPVGSSSQGATGSSSSILQGQHQTQPQAQQQLITTSPEAFSTAAVSEEEGACLSEQLLTDPHHHPSSLAVDVPKASSSHQLPSLELRQHKRGPGILRAQTLIGWQHQAQLRPSLPMMAPRKVVAGVGAVHCCCGAGGVVVAPV